MKQFYFFLTVLLIFASFLTNSQAQTPQYYNANSGGTGNSIPFGSAALNGYKSQYLIGPGEYLLPTPAPPGNITKFYVYMSTTGGPATFTQLTIKMGQTADTMFSTGPYSGQLDTVYYNASATLSSTTNNWMMITLDRPFNYNPAQSLVIEISHCGYSGSGMSVWQTIGYTDVFRRNNIPGTTSCVFTYSSQDIRRLQCGIDVINAAQLYYNYSTGLGANSFPLNVAGGKMVQWLVGPGEFNQPSPAPYSSILGLSVRIATGYPLAPTTYSQFKILLGQTTITSLTSGAFYTGQRDTVYSRASVTLSAAADTWLNFVLDEPFTYNPAQSLVIQIEQCGAPGVTGYSLAHTTVTVNRRVWSVSGCPFTPYSSTDVTVLNCGINATPLSGFVPVVLQVPDKYKLEQNYPNPFNPVTKINYSITKTGFVTLKVYGILGQEIATLVNDVKTAGNYFVDFDASNFASGVYFYKITVNDFTATKKMTVIK